MLGMDEREVGHDERAHRGERGVAARECSITRCMGSWWRMSSPTEPKCPHVGTLFNPMAVTQRDELHALYARMREEEPVLHSPIFNMYFVSRYEDALKVTLDPERFTVANSFNKLSAAFIPEAWELIKQSHTFMAPNMFTSDLEHTRLRAPFGRLFAPSRVATLEPMVRRIANELLDAFPAEGTVDYVDAFAFPFPLRVMMEILGLPLEVLPMMRRGAHAVTVVITALVPAEQQVKLARDVLDYERFWLDLIEERRAHPGEDLISTTVKAIDSGESKLTVPEFVSTICANLVLAGHETTARALGNGLWLLMAHREHWQAIVDEPGLIHDMVDELLRFDSTTTGFFRTATQEVEIGGVTIPEGAVVFPVYASANVDPGKFEEPDRIDAGRANVSEHLGFGKGTHFCLGAHLARLELRVALESLSTRWPGLAIAPGVEVEHAATLAQRGPVSLPLVLG